MENSLQKNTGYAHLDKPWMKFYQGRDLTQEIPETNVVEYLKNETKDWQENIASDYYGKKYTYRELFHRQMLHLLF